VTCSLFDTAGFVPNIEAAGELLRQAAATRLVGAKHGEFLLP
jgi:hypothetical protein